MSEDKVRTKDPCWYVGTIYDPRELLLELALSSKEANKDEQW
jgi:hypothetical protein